ncbi:9063_t:CDS:2 [Funneliformis geosporum]|nr:9063_t:CDS:2 [Funneliformis geosporum]
MYFDQNELQAKIQNQLVKLSIKCIEEVKPYFRILANTAKSEEEEYENETLFETNLFQIKNENEERKIHSDSEIDKNELESDVEENETIEQKTEFAIE